MKKELSAIFARAEKAMRARGVVPAPQAMPAQEILGTYPLKEEELSRHRQRILEIEAAQCVCKVCLGEECALTPRGMVPLVGAKYGLFYDMLSPCRYERARRAQKKQGRLLASAHVPTCYKGKTFLDYAVTKDNEKALKAAQWLVSEEPRRGLFLYGPRGTGKTMLAAIVAQEMAKQGRAVLFLTAPDLLYELKKSFGTGKTADILGAARQAPCLVLDDLGAEKLTEWAAEQFFSVFNYRYGEALQTIVTSNYAPKELEKHLAVRKKDGTLDSTQAGRILSRISGMCEPVYLGGKDWREAGI